MGYWNAQNFGRSAEWSRKAHVRAPSCTTAYNCAVTRKRQGDLDGHARYMEESLRLEPEYAPTLTVYGHTLRDEGDPRGLEYVGRAFALLEAKLKDRTLSESECRLLQRNAETLGRRGILAALREYRKTLVVDDSVIREEFLAAGLNRGDEKLQS